MVLVLAANPACQLPIRLGSGADEIVAASPPEQTVAQFEGEEMEPFFESNPWLLIPIIILTVEGWAAFKRAVMAWRDKERPRSKAR